MTGRAQGERDEAGAGPVPGPRTASRFDPAARPGTASRPHARGADPATAVASPGDAARARERRIAVVGVASTGKSTLARRLASRLGVPAFHLDNVADRLGHADPSIPHAPIGEFPDHPFVPRPLADRLAIAADLAARPGWVAEGPFIEWLGPLLERADTIVWLDQAGLAGSVRATIRRGFASRGRAPSASAPPSPEAAVPPRPIRIPPPVRRVAQLLRHGFGLAHETWDVAGYHWWRRAPGVEADIRAGRWDRLTRRQVEAALAPHAGRVVRVRTWAGVDAVLDAIAAQPDAPDAAR